MVYTIIGTICALVLGKIAYDTEKNQDTTALQLIVLPLLLLAIGITGGVSGLNAQVNWSDWIKFFCGAFGMFMPVYAVYALIKAKDKKEQLGYCGFSGLLYAFAGLTILGIAIVIEIIGTFGILLGTLFQKSRG